MPAPVLEVSGLRKSFGPNPVLKDLDLTVLPGEVHALMGENGAGKSTLINSVVGAIAPDAGDVRFLGEPILGRSMAEVRALGISVVFQEFSLIPDLSVTENLFLGRELRHAGFLAHRAMVRAATGFLADLDFRLDTGARVGDLSRAHQQMVEIAKALLGDPRLLILDEPTASLTNAESERLFALLGRLKARGVASIYVSHRMPEIRRLADRVTVLRDGRHVGTIDADAADDQRLIEMMTGRRLGLLYPELSHRPAEIRLEARQVSTRSGTVRDASFRLRAGEVVGIAGLEGSGKSALARAVFGLEPLRGGTVELDGVAVPRPSPSMLLSRGLCYFTSDRVAEGLALDRPIRENMMATAFGEAARFGLIRRGAEAREARRLAERMLLRPLDVEPAVGRLSGGNRQKVLLARGLARRTGVFFLDEPTVGIDVGAKLEVYEMIAGLVAEGAAVLLVSSDMPEILNLCHRAYVMNGGRIVAELEGAAMSETAILSHFFTRPPQGAAA